MSRGYGKIERDALAVCGIIGRMRQRLAQRHKVSTPSALSSASTSKGLASSSG